MSKDQDARIGHKTYDTSFFGYKTHLAMTEERIITAATVTSGKKHDGKQLKELVDKSRAVGIEVDTIIGDAAYSEKENIEYVEGEKIKTYFFDIKKCKRCPFKKGCYKDEANTKTYSVSIKTNTHQKQHGYDVASSSGLIGIEMQGAATIFAVNMKRIIKLMAQKGVCQKIACVRKSECLLEKSKTQLI